jgi:dolichyl-phosphate beta-glucosyltransferase
VREGCDPVTYEDLHDPARRSLRLPRIGTGVVRGRTPPHQPDRPDAPEIGVVIPAFNEALRIEAPLRAIDAHLCGLGLPSEIVVVDDGSDDGTADLVWTIAQSLTTPLTLVRSGQNRGKGHAVKRGMLEARGRHLLMTDADLSTPIDELGGLLEIARGGGELVIGSRRTAGARIELHQPWPREAMGRIFSALVRWLVADVADTTCGFKLFSRSAARAIFARTTLDDWSFDAEVLAVARRLGIAVHEAPVRWRDVPGTKVHWLRDALRSLAGLARIRWNLASGVYDCASGAAAWTASAVEIRRTHPEVASGS